jgi:hypothetical protein
MSSKTRPQTPEKQDLYAPATLPKLDRIRGALKLAIQKIRELPEAAYEPDDNQGRATVRQIRGLHLLASYLEEQHLSEESQA